MISFLYFCNSKWDMEMDFTENGLSIVNGNDKISEFFQNMKVWIRENNVKNELKFNEIDININYLLFLIINIFLFTPL